MTNTNYSALLSPFKLCGSVLKNRIIAAPSTPMYIESFQPYPTEAVIQSYAQKAKTASIVTVSGWRNTPVKPSKEAHGVMMWDWDNGGVQEHIIRLTESIHYYGSLASTFIFPEFDDDYDAGEGVPVDEVWPRPGRPQFSKMQIEAMVQSYADKAALAQELGFDGMYLHAAYRGLPVARFLSPLCNNRTDEFGGSLENRARCLMMICDAVKQRCGENFFIELCISGKDHKPGGLTLQDTMDVIKMGEGKFDLVQLRAPSMDPAHPTGYYKERMPYLYMAEAAKEAGIKTPIVGVAGYLYPEISEEVLRAGTIDFVAMGRAWVSNPDYGDIISEGRRDDLVPCIRCNRCYTQGGNISVWNDVCSVNPMWGWESRKHLFIAPVGKKKRIAIVGGGPAGMEAAMVSAKRGHAVTLYEKESTLGGQLNLAEQPSFKWPIRDYKQYLIRQVDKLNIRVLLNTVATAELLERGGYDEIIAAVGAKPVIPRIPGCDGSNVISAWDVYGKEHTLPQKLIIVGGGEIGMETGLHLAEKGHQVQLIEMGDTLAPEAPRMHFRSMMLEYVEKTEGFQYTLNAVCQRITEDGLVYTDQSGAEHKLNGDMIILAVGSAPCQDEAMALFAPGRRVLMIGDCKKTANIQRATQSGFAIASQL